MINQPPSIPKYSHLTHENVMAIIQEYRTAAIDNFDEDPDLWTTVYTVADCSRVIVEEIRMEHGDHPELYAELANSINSQMLEIGRDLTAYLDSLDAEPDTEMISEYAEKELSHTIGMMRLLYERNIPESPKGLS